MAFKKTKNKRILRFILWGSLFFVFTVVLLFAISNPWNAKCIGDIPTTEGFTRSSGDDSYTSFLRAIPLKKRGTFVHLHNGKFARLQLLSAGVIDWPVLSQHEQCADVTMRIRAEYLWKTKQYGKINFKTVSGKNQPYSGGSSRKELEKYLRNIYGYSNTTSVYHETKVRDLNDVKPGDILVYPSRHKGAYGHAVFVADVARNKSGEIAILCVEGNTPAREAHVVRNPNPFRNPWFVFNGDEKDIWVSVFRFNRNELKHY